MRSATSPSGSTSGEKPAVVSRATDRLDRPLRASGAPSRAAAGEALGQLCRPAPTDRPRVRPRGRRSWRGARPSPSRARRSRPDGPPGAASSDRAARGRSGGDRAPVAPRVPPEGGAGDQAVVDESRRGAPGWCWGVRRGRPQGRRSSPPPRAECGIHELIPRPTHPPDPPVTPRRHRGSRSPRALAPGRPAPAAGPSGRRQMWAPSPGVAPRGRVGYFPHGQCNKSARPVRTPRSHRDRPRPPPRLGRQRGRVCLRLRATGASRSST